MLTRWHSGVKQVSGNKAEVSLEVMKHFLISFLFAVAVIDMRQDCGDITTFTIEL